MRSLSQSGLQLTICSLLIALTTIAMGCKSQPETPSIAEQVTAQIAEHRTVVETELAHFTAIHRALPGIPPLEADGVQVEAGAINFQINLDQFHRNLEANARIVMAEELEDLTRFADTFIKPDTPDWLVSSAAAVDRNETPNGGSILSPTELANYFTELSSVRYLLVLRTTAYQEPRLTGESIFQTGLYTADALLFEVESHEYLGGFRIRATNAAEVTDHASSDSLTHLVIDLGMEVRRSLDEAVSRRFPGAGLPYGYFD